MPFRRKTVFSNTKRKKDKRRKSKAWVGRGGMEYSREQREGLIDYFVSLPSLIPGANHPEELIRAARILENGFNFNNDLVANAPFNALRRAAIIFAFVQLKNWYPKQRIDADAVLDLQMHDPIRVFPANEAYHAVKCCAVPARVGEKGVDGVEITAQIVADEDFAYNTASSIIDYQIGIVIAREFFGHIITHPEHVTNKRDLMEDYDFKDIAMSSIMTAWERYNSAQPTALSKTSPEIKGKSLRDICSYLRGGFLSNQGIEFHSLNPVINVANEAQDAKDAFDDAVARDLTKMEDGEHVVVTAPAVPILKGGRSRRRRTRRTLRRR